MNYNSLPYEELLKVARALVDHVPITPPNRGIDSFTIEHNIEVIAKERPRDGTFHTPPKTRKFESAVAEVARQAMRASGFVQPFIFPLSVELVVYQAPAKSWSELKKQLALNELVFINLRDLDNMEKAVMDAFNGVVFKDDRQIVRVEKSNVASAYPGFYARFTPIGLTKNEADRTEHIAKQLRKGNIA